MQTLFWPRDVTPVANVGIRVNSTSRHKLSLAREQRRPTFIAIKNNGFDYVNQVNDSRNLISFFVLIFFLIKYFSNI